MDVHWNGVMFAALDRAGNVTLINRKGCEVLATKPEHIVGKNWFHHFIPERMREGINTVFQGLMHGKLNSVNILRTLS